MKRLCTQSLLAIVLAYLVFPAQAFAFVEHFPDDGPNTTGDSPLIDSSTDKTKCSQTNGGTITTPAGKVIPLNGCASTTLDDTDISTSSASGTNTLHGSEHIVFATSTTIATSTLTSTVTSTTTASGCRFRPA